MPVRDLRGEEIPVGKIERRLRFDGLAATASPEWMTPFGGASESKGDVADGRGELNLAVADGVGGYELPWFDTDAFRELRLVVGFRHDVSDEGVVRVGFADADGASTDGGWCHYREPGESEPQRGGGVSCGRLRFGQEGEETTTGDLAIALDASGGSSLLEVRLRPFERGVTVAVGGAGRGDVVYEDDGCPFAFDGPVRPTVGIDATASAGTERLSLSTVRLAALHN